MARGKLKDILDSYMAKAPGVREVCDRCLNTQRWGGSVVLMVVDAAFTSIGLNYFTSVVPAVQRFRKTFMETGEIGSCADLAAAPLRSLRRVWKNRRSWHLAREAARCIARLPGGDREAFRGWAAQADPAEWKNDPIGKIRGVGINTFQYLRMMGGIDTVMPDTIVKRVLLDIMRRGGVSPLPRTDLEFIRAAEETARACGYRPIDVCWMTWMVQSEGELMRSEKYADVLHLI